MAHPLDIAEAYRHIYRAKFWNQVSTGAKRPFLIPWSFLGVWILPTLYLAVPHRNRPWVYRARWLVLALAVLLNCDTIFNVSSDNFATAYGAGLLGAWGIIWNFTLLVWTRPQWDARRVNIRRKVETEAKAYGKEDGQSQGRGLAGDGPGKELISARVSSLELSGHTTVDDNPPHGLRARQEHDRSDDDVELPVELDAMSEEPRKAVLDAISALKLQNNGVLTAAYLDKLAAEQEFEYYWQEFPADASFWTRLGWSFDLVGNLRMTGWNWAISCLPPYAPPLKLRGYQLPLSSAGPHRSRQGFTRQLTRAGLLSERLCWAILPGYLAVDFCAVYMTADPYFVLGPEHDLGHPFALSPGAAAHHRQHVPLPPHLASLPPWALGASRIALSFVGILAALHLALGIATLALTVVPPLRWALGFRADPWHYPSIDGSFAQVLDRGLAGFWGAWWHQTFRFAFEAPARWLLRRWEGRDGHDGGDGNGNGGGGRDGSGTNPPYAPQTRAYLLAASAFLQSGFLHAAASHSTVPAHTRWQDPPLFFLLAGAGAVLQSRLSRAAARRRFLRGPAPRWARRAGNLAFAAGWLALTSWALADDFGRCGLWLFEPVPLSAVRALGLAPRGADRRAWRYGAGFRPRWHAGGHWWDTGIAI
ncbi:hypothetical protein GGS23DRAFT_615123 [Durotheca rogersii]|uniref:uncharacterized protein n=1 Tax=Durotheca rogersii TaxID=419775 RepID=UPI0022201859|nr:uncharacterized protein GGS23DRAFT_615123 [Durotheca rogersii]KAI5866583.1 hypothetical protein GGS23DRAFT_615123 [Durotheca rogersii]